MSTLACSNPKLDRVSPLPYLVSLQRIGRFFIIYSTALTLSLLLAYAIRFDMWVPQEEVRYIPMILAGVVPHFINFTCCPHILAYRLCCAWPRRSVVRGCFWPLRGGSGIWGMLCLSALFCWMRFWDCSS